MLKKVFLVILISLVFFNVMGQKSSVDFTTVDSGTLRYFNSGQYDSLIILGNQALHNDLDYFYLRYRMGYAYFYTNKFRKAAEQFEKALKFNSMDESTIKYLYYAYKNSGNEAEAMAISKDISPEFFNKKKNQKKISLLNIYTEGGYGFTDNIKKNSNLDLDGNLNIRGVSTLTRSVTYLHAGCKLQAGNILSIYQGYSFIFISKQKNIQVHNTITKFNYDILQHEYYINTDLRAYKNLLITPAFHFIYVSYKEPFVDSISRIIIRPLTELYNYTGSLMITKDIRLMKLGLGGTFSYLNNDYKIQAMISADFFPLGNLNLYTHTLAVFLYEDKPLPHHIERRLVLEQMIGVKVFKKLWSELGFTYGDLSSYAEKNAFVIYNYTDKTRFRAEISLLSPIFSKFELSLRYQFFSKQDFYRFYTDNISFKYKPINYTQHNIIGGIKWKF